MIKSTEANHSDLPSRKSLKGTWILAFAELFGAIVFVLAVRWALFEPYAIPSGSMIPTLLIHDHILVNKFAYGLRIPFKKDYLLRWSQPKRGEVVVFRSVENEDTYMVKRVVGVPGDQIEIRENGHLVVNGTPVANEKIEADVSLNLDEFSDYSWVRETLDGTSFRTIRSERTNAPPGPFTVGENQLFLMGDNRENSSDSRMWGPLPLDHVLGRASVIWLSCEETLREASRICNPTTIRWKRMFRALQ